MGGFFLICPVGRSDAEPWGLVVPGASLGQPNVAGVAVDRESLRWPKPHQDSEDRSAR